LFIIQYICSLPFADNGFKSKLLVLKMLSLPVSKAAFSTFQGIYMTWQPEITIRSVGFMCPRYFERSLDKAF